ncbi:MAG: efflux RND transporter periplasmic adaptor subunit [Bacteroidetes bacterium]|nr:efflux RND transporter periplasmic adaptor subunit [Bacteroidota bacterium]
MNKIHPLLIKVCGFLCILLILISCNRKKQEAPPPPEIPVVEVIQKDVPIYRQFVGQVYGNSDIPIRARVAGFLEELHFYEGLEVDKGQLLYSIDPSEYQAKVSTQESHLAEAKTELAKAKSDLDRIEPLAEINAVSKSDLDAARANYNAALAYVDAQTSNLKYANINLGYCWIKSPISGIIGQTEARKGEFVGKDPNPVILNTVSTVDTVRVEFFLAEADYIRLSRLLPRVRDYDPKKRAAPVPNLSLILADGSTFEQKGYVNFINREVDPQTGSLLVQTTFPNPDYLLKPGQYAKVVIKLDEVPGGLLIPQRCVMELQGQYSVYVINNNNKVESRQIKAGDIIGDMLLVKEGLKAGEKVVIDALQKVSTGMTVKPKLTVFESQSNYQF